MFGRVKVEVEVLDESDFRLHKFEGLPDLVAELSKGDNLIDIEIDVSALHHVGQESKSQGIRAALRNTLSKLMLQLSNRRVLLSFRQSAILYFVDKIVKGSSIDDLERVYSVALGFTHLGTLAVTHHRMKEHFFEGQFAGQPQRHHHHASHPEEQDIMACLQHLVREESLEVRMLLFGPHQGREGEET